MIARMQTSPELGAETEFMTLTRGPGLPSHVFDEYAPAKSDSGERRNGALVSQEDGVAVAYEVSAAMPLTARS